MPLHQKTHTDIHTRIYTVSNLTVTLLTNKKKWHESTRLSLHPDTEVHNHCNIASRVRCIRRLARP